MGEVGGSEGDEGGVRLRVGVGLGVAFGEEDGLVFGAAGHEGAGTELVS